MKGEMGNRRAECAFDFDVQTNHVSEREGREKEANGNARIDAGQVEVQETYAGRIGVVVKES